jgi:hypothetical protein
MLFIGPVYACLRVSGDGSLRNLTAIDAHSLQISYGGRRKNYDSNIRTQLELFLDGCVLVNTVCL